MHPFSMTFKRNPQDMFAEFNASTNNGFSNEFVQPWYMEVGSEIFEGETFEGETSTNFASCNPKRFKTNTLRISVWKKRVNPKNRRIPKKRKLASLARGRIRLKTERIGWLLETNKSLEWVKHLAMDPSEFMPEVDVTIELIINQRPGKLTNKKISSMLDRYLIFRVKKYIKNCPFWIRQWDLAFKKKDYESSNRLNFSLTELFKQAGVPLPENMNRKDRQQYILLIYATFPRDVKQFFITPSRSPKKRMPPLTGRLEMGCYNLRKGIGTSSKVAGSIVDRPVLVRVIEKSLKNKDVWYKIRLKKTIKASPKMTAAECNSGVRKAKTITLSARKKYWFGLGEKLIRVVDWNFFRHQVREFEQQYKDLSLNARITKMRQLSHTSRFDFDQVIGTQKGNEYLDSTPFLDNEWQMFKDYAVVRMPDGKWVDIHHLLVGLDVLRRRETRVIYYPARMDIGTNWAAATWAGDLGSAAAEATLKLEKGWHKRTPNLRRSKISKFYFKTRSAEWDLLANIDAWGINGMRWNHRLDSLEKLLAYYYEDISSDNPKLTKSRKESIELFLKHYGFKYEYKRHINNYPALQKQARARKRIAAEIAKFAKIWFFYRGGVAVLFKQPEYIAHMTYRFLLWLERLAIENGSTVT